MTLQKNLNSVRLASTKWLLRLQKNVIFENVTSLLQEFFFFLYNKKAKMKVWAIGAKNLAIFIGLFCCVEAKEVVPTSSLPPLSNCREKPIPPSAPEKKKDKDREGKKRIRLKLPSPPKEEPFFHLPLCESCKSVPIDIDKKRLFQSADKRSMQSINTLIPSNCEAAAKKVTHPSAAPPYRSLHPFSR